MNFDENQAIYLQIADYIAEKILTKEWKQDERIPSVRELAKNLKVNVNTAMRAYGFLQDKNIINNQRGIGYFASSSAVELAMEWKRKIFTEHELPKVFHQATLLGYTASEINNLYNTFLEKKHG